LKKKEKEKKEESERPGSKKVCTHMVYRDPSTLFIRPAIIFSHLLQVEKQVVNEIVI
jgi:hypothetical protein